MEKLYTVVDLCEYFGVTRQAVSRWIQNGKLKVIRLPSNTIRITKEAFDRLKEDRYE